MTSIVCATQTQEGTHTRNPFRRIVKRVWQGDLFPWISAERLWVKREKNDCDMLLFAPAVISYILYVWNDSKNQVSEDDYMLLWGFKSYNVMS